MNRYSCFLVAAAAMLCFAAASNVRADFFAPGATLQVTYSDPSTGAQNTEIVPFNPNGPASSLDNGVLSISEQTLMVNSRTEWVQFDLQTTSGGPLTFSSEDFDVNFNNVNMTTTAGWIGNYLAFTLNGTTSGDPFFYSLFPDPVTPSAGKVAGNFYPLLTSSPFYGNVFFPNPPAAFYMFARPVGAFFPGWGVDPNVNGFLAGVELQTPATPTPEPSSLALCTAGLIALVGGRLCRRKRAA